jgi:hypothetical protein
VLKVEAGKKWSFWKGTGEVEQGVCDEVLPLFCLPSVRLLFLQSSRSSALLLLSSLSLKIGSTKSDEGRQRPTV